MAAAVDWAPHLPVHLGGLAPGRPAGMQSVTRPSELSHSVCLWKSLTTCTAWGSALTVPRQRCLLALARNEAEISASAAAATDTAAVGPALTL